MSRVEMPPAMQARPPGQPTPKRRRGALFGIGFIAVALLLAAIGILSRESAVAALAGRADDAAIPRVQVIAPKPGPPRRALTLPGNINAWYQAPIYAQVAGYVKSWSKDYGAQVKAGERLAVIDSPTIDAQLAAAKAQLAVAQARDKLAQVTAKRYQALSGTQAVSQQEIDIQVANAAVQHSLVEAAQHDVARYQAQVGFEQVVAPFDGVVTARLTDIGDYVNAAGGDVNARGAASELFSVADIHEMRLFVSLPQDYSDILKPGLTATFTLPNAPERHETATFLTSANAVNPQTRTIVTELVIENTDHRFWPGTYASVHFEVPSNPDILILPEQALLFRAQGMQVALLDGHGRVHLQNITLGLNLGNSVQVLAGLKKTDRVINNPSLGLLEGEQVKIVQPAPGYADASAAPATPDQLPARSASGLIEPAAGPEADGGR
jgi:membrane fusion protein (multidrug efflux system)